MTWVDLAHVQSGGTSLGDSFGDQREGGETREALYILRSVEFCIKPFSDESGGKATGKTEDDRDDKVKSQFRRRRFKGRTSTRSNNRAGARVDALPVAMRPRARACARTPVSARRQRAARTATLWARPHMRQLAAFRRRRPQHSCRGRQFESRARQRPDCWHASRRSSCSRRSLLAHVPPHPNAFVQLHTYFEHDLSTARAGRRNGEGGGAHGYTQRPRAATAPTNTHRPESVRRASTAARTRRRACLPVRGECESAGGQHSALPGGCRNSWAGGSSSRQVRHVERHPARAGLRHAGARRW